MTFPVPGFSCNGLLPVTGFVRYWFFLSRDFSRYGLFPLRAFPLRAFPVTGFSRFRLFPFFLLLVLSIAGSFP